MTWTQTIILSLIQGLTEFLPVSSSAHLILVPSLLGWPDQGLAFDVAVHVGTLIAILVYFWADLKILCKDCLSSIVQARLIGEACLVWFVVLATIPVGLLALALKSLIEVHCRSTQVIAYATIGFGLLLWIADRFNAKTRSLSTLNWRDALLVGLAQAVSLIPGTSRSGITLMAGLMRGFNRAAAVRFSFLLAIPVIALAGTVEVFSLIKSPGMIEWQFLVGGACIAGFSGYACMHYFLKLVDHIGLWPFVLYRLGLGLVLLST